MLKKKQKQPEGRSVQRTGQSQSPVFSYYSNRSGGDNERARYEEPKKIQFKGTERLRHLPTLFAAIAIFGCLVYASLLDNRPRIIVATTTSGKSLQRPTQVYEDYIASQLSKSTLNKSKLTFDTNSVTADLQKQFPEVANAIVTIPLVGHRPVVRIAVSSPAFVLATSGGAYYISTDGRPLVKVSDVANPLSNMNTVADNTNLPVTIGKQALPTDTVLFITSVIEQLKATNTPVQSIVLPLEANELQIRAVGQSYIIRFNTQEDARLQVGTYLAVKKRLEGSREVPKEYIDVRVEERAYYK